MMMLNQLSFRLSTLANQVAPSQAANNGIIVEHFKGFSKVTISNPKSLNSLNLPMIHELMNHLPALEKTKAFWVEGAGGKAFCAGGDIKSLYEARETNRQLLSDFFRYQNTLDYKLSRMVSYQISNWDGFVMGGGVGMSVFSPFKIATERTVFAMPEAKIGFFTDVGGGYFLSRLRNNIGYYLGLTSARLKGQEVFLAGLANYYIPSASIPDVYKEIKQELSFSREPKESIEAILGKYNKAPKTRKIEHEQDIRYIFNSKSLEEIFDKLNQNKTPFYKTIKESIEAQCPLSVAAIFKSIKQSKTKTARECFINDFALTQNFMAGKDFFEGVRCTLVDKGATPKWTHKHWSQVTESELKALFEPLPEDKELKL